MMKCTSIGLVFRKLSTAWMYHGGASYISAKLCEVTYFVFFISSKGELGNRLEILLGHRVDML
jgi:hypothetical protein